MRDFDPEFQKHLIEDDRLWFVLDWWVTPEMPFDHDDIRARENPRKFLTHYRRRNKSRPLREQFDFALHHGEIRCMESYISLGKASISIYMMSLLVNLPEREAVEFKLRFH